MYLKPFNAIGYPFVSKEDPMHWRLLEIAYAYSIAFFKEFKLVGKFSKRATKNWKMLCNHALQTHIQSRLRLLHVDNFKIILSLQKQLNL